MNKINLLLVMFLLIITFNCCEKDDYPILGIDYILAGDTTGCYYIDLIPDMEIVAKSYTSDPYHREANGYISLPNSDSYDLKLGVSVSIDAMGSIYGPQKNDTCKVIWKSFSIQTGDHTEIAVIDNRNECGTIFNVLPLQLSQDEKIDRNLTWMYGQIPYPSFVIMPDSTTFLPIRRFSNKGILYGWIKLYNGKSEYFKHKDYATTYIYDKWIIGEYAIQKSRNI